MNPSPTITVLVTCYKEGLLLQRALESVLLQTDRDFELVVVNDASPCAVTSEICRSIVQGAKVKVVMRAKNGGPSAARNTGIGLASGEVIVLLDGDDVLPRDCIEVVRYTFTTHPDADYCFGNYVRRNVDTGESVVVDCSVLTDGNGWLDPHRYAVNYIFYCGSPFRKAMWAKVGGYRSALDGWEDVDLWMRAMTAGARGVYLPHVIYEWNRSGQGVNATVPLHIIWETHLRNRRFHEKFGDWAVTVEGFLDYAISGYENPGTRTVARRCLLFLLPVPRGCVWRFLRVVLKCTMPVFLVNQLVKQRPVTVNSNNIENR